MVGRASNQHENAEEGSKPITEHPSVKGGSAPNAETGNLTLIPEGSGHATLLRPYVNETYWDGGGGGMTGGDNSDCNQWSDEQQRLYYDRDSCKVGVLANIKKSWRKATLVNVVVLVILVVVYVVACAAFRHSRRIDNDEPRDENRMEKEQPSANHF
ncbi:hypothetical protein U1Q18_010972 [Sarracenia purpurea var. burkii]